MNKSQRIYLGTGNTSNAGLDMHIKIKLEQDVDSLEFLTMKLDTKEIYQNFNSDYGVLVGRVIANEGIGVPNTKISIFIPLTDTDAEDGEIVSIYPYVNPRDKNKDGKRYNLLPRVSQYSSSLGTYKPVQPFGSFLIKPELVTNQPFLDVYKKYYKYTALTNDNGDYMIFGVPTGTQTVHMSVDITDIGKYSMSPQSMVVAGYPANLFTDNGNRIKVSSDLTDLPNIETQEVGIDIIPFWGDTTNFEIGITRQDFRIRASVQSSFVIFGTSMTMGTSALYGYPKNNGSNVGFYSIAPYLVTPILPTDYNNIDVRVNRVAPIEIKVFTFSKNIPIGSDGKLIFDSSFDCDKDIIEVSETEYYKYVDRKGNFGLDIPCNRVKVVTNDLGITTIVDDNSSIGVYSKFYGMILAKYPDTETLPIADPQGKFWGNHPSHPSRGWFKIPQSIGLAMDGAEDLGEGYPFLDWKNNNDSWRKEHKVFSGGTIYSVAQFFPTKNPLGIKENAARQLTPNTFGNIGTKEDGGTAPINFTEQGGAWFKVAGDDLVAQSSYDNDNYIINPSTGTTPQFRYDFSPNVTVFSNVIDAATFFGGQWLNFCLFFPQYGFAFDSSNSDRLYDTADVYHNNYDNLYFVQDNRQKIFAGLSNTKNLLKGDSFRTDFIVVPKEELEKLRLINQKGINIGRFNVGSDIIPNPSNTIHLSPKTYRYEKIKPLSATVTGRQYDKFGWDDYVSSYASVPEGEIPTAYLFRGMYDNDCVQLVFDLGLI